MEGIQNPSAYSMQKTLYCVMLWTKDLDTSPQPTPTTIPAATGYNFEVACLVLVRTTDNLVNHR
jgi:hypothetical protein